MKPYNVWFSLPFGNMLCLRMQWDEKDKTLDEFMSDIRHIELRLNITFIYKEEV